MLMIRPLSSEGALSCIRVLAIGQKNPVLAIPRKKKMIHDGQYQVDQANKARNIHTAVSYTHLTLPTNREV